MADMPDEIDTIERRDTRRRYDGFERRA